MHYPACDIVKGWNVMLIPPGNCWQRSFHQEKGELLARLPFSK
jgi:hypothetical protein